MGEFMNKKRFLFILIGITALLILTFILKTLFNEQTTNFGISCGMFFLSLFCLSCYKNALKPTNNFGPINRTKKHFEKKKELYKYEALCKTLFIITISIAVLTLIGGFWEIFILYMKSIFSN